RRFRHGEIYTPKDLSFESFKNSRKRRAPFKDAFDTLALNPLKEYKNFNLLSEYTTEMGRIKHRSETGLRGVNQRKIAKAIRRAVGIGLLPSTHKHPELL
ncbi:ribosomal protein S18, partial [Tirmania nivea]